MREINLEIVKGLIKDEPVAIDEWQSVAELIAERLKKSARFWEVCTLGESIGFQPKDRSPHRSLGEDRPAHSGDYTLSTKGWFTRQNGPPRPNSFWGVTETGELLYGDFDLSEDGNRCTHVHTMGANLRELVMHGMKPRMIVISLINRHHDLLRDLKSALDRVRENHEEIKLFQTLLQASEERRENLEAVEW